MWVIRKCKSTYFKLENSRYVLGCFFIEFFKKNLKLTFYFLWNVTVYATFEKDKKMKLFINFPFKNVNFEKHLMIAKMKSEKQSLIQIIELR